MTILKIYLAIGFVIGVLEAAYNIYVGSNSPVKTFFRGYLLNQFCWGVVQPLAVARGFVIAIVRQELRAAFQAQSKFKRKQ